MDEAVIEEKRINHYTSSQKILLVGEGDFSFALCLAKAFGSGSNIVATSLDSRDEVVAKYSNGGKNLKELEELGCTIIQEVDSHFMNAELSVLIRRPFDRIVFNFLHAPLILREHDWSQISSHKEVVEGFLRSARELISLHGEIHVTHKTAHPFNKWEIEELAEENRLHSVGAYCGFYVWDYPGYINKRGSGLNCDQTFPVGQCRTFKFGL